MLRVPSFPPRSPWVVLWTVERSKLPGVRAPLLPTGLEAPLLPSGPPQIYHFFKLSAGPCSGFPSLALLLLFLCLTGHLGVFQSIGISSSGAFVYLCAPSCVSSLCGVHGRAGVLALLRSVSIVGWLLPGSRCTLQFRLSLRPSFWSVPGLVWSSSLILLRSSSIPVTSLGLSSLFLPPLVDAREALLVLCFTLVGLAWWGLPSVLLFSSYFSTASVVSVRPSGFRG